MTNEMQWFLLQTKVKQEQRAAENLERQDVASFCPMIRVDKISRGRRSEVLDVLFPGYLFVQLGESSVSTTAVRSTRGVSHFVTSAGAPIKVPQGLVEQLRQRVTADADVVMSQLPKSGAKMQVIDGPFKGLNAVFTEPDGNNRAIVMVTLLSQQVKTSMPFASLVEDTHG
ncbi:MAG: Transcription antitermination protein RfaH [Porticoccaceae bacterium UBA1117]|jgi:transcriptional antiterminator RfaH|nr:MAG: Transcription antitermination protein RfaH [Porticoccaceae bacterium UBA1117]|tara:strand:- start:727 stop:1239 length:513 start_codon:yes stop_codon:yes gene_type:complete